MQAGSLLEGKPRGALLQAHVVLGRMLAPESCWTEGPSPIGKSRLPHLPNEQGPPAAQPLLSQSQQAWRQRTVSQEDTSHDFGASRWEFLLVPLLRHDLPGQLPLKGRGMVQGCEDQQAGIAGTSVCHDALLRYPPFTSGVAVTPGSFCLRWCPLTTSGVAVSCAEGGAELLPFHS